MCDEICNKKSVVKTKGMRKQLENFSTIDDVLDAFDKAKHIVFITGAGISVSCGIPDFRSASGIYNTMECQEIGIPSPELLFDLEYFLMDPGPFFKYAHNLIPKARNPSAAHRFIALLESKKKLLRHYTQNIDGLERVCGQKKVVECHGSMNTFQCLECRKKISLSEVESTILKGDIPLCAHCKGVMKPMITFFGEEGPPVVRRHAEEDMRKCDLIVVMGTSLRVGGTVVDLLCQARREVPQVLINLNPIRPPSPLSSEGFDISLLGECDDVVAFLAEMIQIDKDTKEIRKMKDKYANLKRRKKCKFCDGTGEIRIPIVLPESTSEDFTRKEGRTRKPSRKCRENADVKSTKIIDMNNATETELIGCNHCQQYRDQLKSLEKLVSPTSTLICQVQEEPRHFRIFDGVFQSEKVKLKEEAKQGTDEINVKPQKNKRRKLNSSSFE